MDDLHAAALHQMARSFDLPQTNDAVESAEMSLDDVKRFLVRAINTLLDKNPAMLMSILYRVDVAEANVKQVFAECPPDHLPHALADLLIERQLQKLRLRRKYSE